MSRTRVVWLHPNRRVLWLGVAFCALLIGGNALAAFMASLDWVRWLCIIVLFPLSYLLAASFFMAISPRLAYENRELLVFLRVGAGPVRVPIDVVECFFLGQGPTLLPQPFGSHRAVDETSTIVVRLAEAAEEWKHLKVKATLGLWCDGYITIRGTWCEPITSELVQRLNQQLIEAHREVRAQQVAATL